MGRVPEEDRDGRDEEVEEEEEGEEEAEREEEERKLDRLKELKSTSWAERGEERGGSDENRGEGEKVGRNVGEGKMEVGRNGRKREE